MKLNTTDVINDKTISHTARGLLLLMMAKPKGSRSLNLYDSPNNSTEVDRAIDELCNRGYIEYRLSPLFTVEPEEEPSPLLTREQAKEAFKAIRAAIED
jgi:hypothetical protein